MTRRHKIGLFVLAACLVVPGGSLVLLGLWIAGRVRLYWDRKRVDAC